MIAKKIDVNDMKKKFCKLRDTLLYFCWYQHFIARN